MLSETVRAMHLLQRYCRGLNNYQYYGSIFLISYSIRFLK